MICALFDLARFILQNQYSFLKCQFRLLSKELQATANLVTMPEQFKIVNVRLELIQTTAKHMEEWGKSDHN